MARGSGGGGYGSRPHVEKPVRTGTGSHSTRPAGVNMFGNMQGSHVTRGEDSSYRGEPLHGGRTLPTMFGNKKALDVGKGGPGTGRTTYACGSQGMTGQPAPGNAPAKSRDILSDFGPDYRRPRSNPGRSDVDADF